MSENKPEVTYRAGAVSCSIWKISVKTKDGKTFDNLSVTIQRGYKDKEGNWKNTDSLKTADIPKAQLVLSKAFEFMTMKDGEATSN